MIEMELGEFGPAAGVNSRRRRDHAGRRIDSVEFGALRVSLHQQSKQVTGTATDIEDSSWSTVGRLRQCCRPLGDLMVQPSQPTLLVARRSVVKAATSRRWDTTEVCHPASGSRRGYCPLSAFSSEPRAAHTAGSVAILTSPRFRRVYG